MLLPDHLIAIFPGVLDISLLPPTTSFSFLAWSLHTDPFSYHLQPRPQTSSVPSHLNSSFLNPQSLTLTLPLPLPFKCLLCWPTPACLPRSSLPPALLLSWTALLFFTVDILDPDVSVCGSSTSSEKGGCLVFWEWITEWPLPCGCHRIKSLL